MLRTLHVTHVKHKGINMLKRKLHFHNNHLRRHLVLQNNGAFPVFSPFGQVKQLMTRAICFEHCSKKHQKILGECIHFVLWNKFSGNFYIYYYFIFYKGILSTAKRKLQFLKKQKIITILIIRIICEEEDTFDVVIKSFYFLYLYLKS